MNTLTASKARTMLYKLLDQSTTAYEPILITGKHSNAVLVTEQDWLSIQETLHLLSIPGIRASIRAGLKTPAGKLPKKLTW